MVEISLKNVKNFDDLLKNIEFNLKLDSSNHTLKIYCLNSELSKEEFFDILGQQYPESEFISDFSHTYIAGINEKEDVNFYCYKDPNSQAIFVLSIVGKGKIDVVVDGLIKKLPRTYYFWLPLSTFDQVKEEIVDHFNNEGIMLDSFTALRSSHFENNCSLRPNESRRIEYEGSDGLEVLRELRSIYGVLPKKIGFEIGKKFRFSMDQRNTFIINYGMPYLDRVLEVIRISLSRFNEIGKVLESIRFEEIKTNGNVDFDATPLIISFGNKKTVQDMERFLESIESNQEGRYCTLNPLLIEGSLFFSATLLDIDKKAIFSISGNEEVMNVLPQSNCGREVISRFYEEVDLSLDNHTKIISENVQRA